MEKKRKKFKERWNEKDEVCPCCGQVVKVNRGLTKQNLKKLFRKPTLNDSIIFIILVLALVGAFAYRNEINYYKNIINNPQELCSIYYHNVFYQYDNLTNTTNNSLLNIITINNTNDPQG